MPQPANFPFQKQTVEVLGQRMAHVRSMRAAARGKPLRIVVLEPNDVLPR